MTAGRVLFAFLPDLRGKKCMVYAGDTVRLMSPAERLENLRDRFPYQAEQKYQALQTVLGSEVLVIRWIGRMQEKGDYLFFQEQAVRGESGFPAENFICCNS